VVTLDISSFVIDRADYSSHREASSIQTREEANKVSAHHELGTPSETHRRQGSSSKTSTEPARCSDAEHNKEKEQGTSESTNTIHRGLSALGIELPKSVVKDMMPRYNGMLPIERFLKEICKREEARTGCGAKPKDRTRNE
jgi:hypothetical protein